MRSHCRGKHTVDVAEAPRVAEGAGTRWRRRAAGWTRNSLWPVDDGSVRPYVDFTHRPDDSRLDPLVDQAGTFARVSLIAHLGHELRVGERRRPQDARFVNRVCERLLHVDMLARIHCGFRDHSVQMVGRRNYNSFDVALFIEHFPEIRVPGCLRELLLKLEAVGELLPFTRLAARVAELVTHVLLDERHVDVGNGDDVFGRSKAEGDFGAASTEANNGDVQRVAGRLKSDTTENVAGHDHYSQTKLATGRDELAPGDFPIGQSFSFCDI